MIAQAVIFSEAAYIRGGTQNRNNPSDLLHLLYLKKGDKFLSNDKIYRTIADAVEDLQLVKINEEKSVLEVIKKLCNNKENDKIL